MSSSSNSSTGGLNFFDRLGNLFNTAFKRILGNNSTLLSLFGLADEEAAEASNSQNGNNVNNTGSKATQTAVGQYATTENNFPYYNQSDPKWGNVNYGTGTISSSGCGPTSMAMMLKSFGTNVTPVETADWSLRNGFRVPNQGTSWSYFPAVSKAYGINGTDLGKNINAVSDSLRNGKAVIASMKPYTFTKGGHFIVLSGVDPSGMIKVNDPASKERSQKVWPLSVFNDEGKNFWSFDKDGIGSINKTFADPERTINKQIDPSVVNKNANKPDESGSGSGLIISDNMYRSPHRSYASNDITKYKASGSGLNTIQRGAISTIKSSIRGGSSGMDINTYNIALAAIEVLKTIATNTSKINSIVQLLTDYFNKKVSGNAQPVAVTSNDSAEFNPDQHTKNLLAQLAAIASE